jgi:hypothetical protein
VLLPRTRHRAGVRRYNIVFSHTLRYSLNPSLENYKRRTKKMKKILFFSYEFTMKTILVFTLLGFSLSSVQAGDEQSLMA